jgi:uncharacterized delta-60 repeat protein
MSAKTKVAGVWRDAIAPYIKVSGAWKIARSAWTKVNGTWKSWFLQGGLLDTSFNSAGANAFVRSIATQSDGKILVGGDFTTFNGSAANKLVRLNTDGTLDTAFTSNLALGSVNTIYSVNVQSDGKILIGGNTQAGGIIRINSNGTLDTSFVANTGTNTDNTVYDVAIQSDGKILAVGEFTTFDEVTTRRIVRLNSNGTVDTAFRANNSGAFGVIQKVAIQPNGQIIVGGNFTNFNGVNTNRIARVNSDGTVDTVFRTNIGTGPNQAVQSIGIKSDGKILLGGSFSSFNSVSRSGLAVLEPTGVLDTTSNFVSNIGSGPNSTISSILFQTDQKIILGGAFSSFGGVVANYVIRLNSDGTKDTAFIANLGTSANSFVFHVASQPDNKLLVGGNFTSFNSQSYGRIARIGGDVAVI